LLNKRARMNLGVDLAASVVVLSSLLVAGAWSSFRARARANRSPLLSERVRALALPANVCLAGLSALEPVVEWLMRMGVSANMVTLASLCAGILSGISLAAGHLGVGGLLFVAASSGDALDGLLARASRSESPRGAIFDASVDRYEEFFAFGGLAIAFRSSELMLTLALAALTGAFMVSYGSVQAEARGIAVPPGLMRRPERAVCLGLGMVLGPLVAAVDPGAERAPVTVAMIAIALLANVSAVRRIRAVAASLSPRAPTHDTRPAAVAAVAAVAVAIVVR